MKHTLSRIKRFFSGSPNVSIIPDTGVYHYLNHDETGKSRLHLRIEKDGHSVLLVNASRVYYFNPSATYMAYHLLENRSQKQIINGITRVFRVSEKQAFDDLQIFSSQFEAIIEPNGRCPICDLNIETTIPFSHYPSAPYRMDLAITYRCNNNCSHCYNLHNRQNKELDTGQWIRILDKLWEIGIPHIVFTGGEPTLRNDLPELIAHAEKNGQITGINTNGRRLMDGEFLLKLVNAGLDHIQITLESHINEIHDEMVGKKGAWIETIAGLKNALSTQLYVMTNTTMLTTNSPYLEETINYLKDIGVATLGLNSLIYSGRGLTTNRGLPESELPQILGLARHLTEKNDQRLIWYTPTQYCHFDPINMELGVKGCTAALYNMCIEPDGNVIPCQSYYHSLGNIFDQQWNSIWNHDLAISLRERRNLPQECMSCSMLQECGGGCPLARQAGSYSKPVPIKAELEAFR